MSMRMVLANLVRVSVVMLVLCGIGGLGWLGLADLRSALLLRNTLLLGLGSCAVAMPLGVPLAWILSRTDAPGRSIGWGIVAGMLALPVYLQAAGWNAGFGSQGWLAAWPELGRRIALEGWAAAIWIHALAAIPWIVLITSRGLLLVEPELEEDALLCAPLSRVVLRVTLRRAAPALMVSAIWVLVLTAGEIAVTDLYQIRTYAEEVYLFGPGAASQPTDWLGGVEELPSGWLVLGLLLVGSLLVTQYLAVAPGFYGTRRALRFSLGRRGWLATAYVAAVSLVMLGIPCANLVFQAGLVVQPQGESWLRFWSAPRFVELVFTAPMAFRAELQWSLAIGGLAATGALAAGLWLAWCARRRTVVAVLAGLGIAAALALPGPVLGLGVIALLNRPGADWLAWFYSHTLLAPVLVQALRAFPVAALVSWYALRSLPDEMFETAELDGVPPWACFVYLVVPQRLAALAAAWLAALAISAGDLAATILTAPPGVTTIPIRVFGLLHAGVDDQAAGVCLAVVLITLLLAALIVWLLRPNRD